MMDLRGFSADNQGCLYELRKLAEHGKLARTLFVLDARSDEALLGAGAAPSAA